MLHKHYAHLGARAKVLPTPMTRFGHSLRPHSPVRRSLLRQSEGPEDGDKAIRGVGGRLRERTALAAWAKGETANGKRAIILSQEANPTPSILEHVRQAGGSGSRCPGPDAASFFQVTGQYGQFIEAAVVVNGLGCLGEGAVVPVKDCGVESDGAEGAAKDVS